MSGSRGTPVGAAAAGGGIGDPGPLVRQEQSVMDAQMVNEVAVLGRTTGQDGFLPPPHDPAVLAETVSGGAV